MTIALISLGCDKNTVDSEIVLGFIKEAGLKTTVDLVQADAVIINTCGFLQDAVNEAKEEVDQAIELKKLGKCKKLIVMGCAAARYPEKFLEVDGVDAVFGVGEHAKIVSFLLEVDDLPNLDMARLRVPSTPGHYAYLRIAEGCDKHCTYCAIPKIRGSYISTPMDDLVEEATYLVKMGVKELVLIAQDTTLYGVDIYGKQSLHILLKKLGEIERLRWIRLLYCYPEHIYDGLLEEMGGNPKVMPYVDLPIQHAADNVLKLMNRQSTNDILRKTIDKIRKTVPGVALRTTLISGFAGETLEDHNELCRFIKDVEFDHLGVFPYSREEGTPADKLEDHLDEKVKLERADELMAIQQEISAKRLTGRVGDVAEAVIEEVDAENWYFGRLAVQAPDIDGIIAIYAERPLNIGEFVMVKITKACDYDLIGELYEPSK
ncbi:MAG: 30S ribosomal protein S12 methylthiotransferase RimO [Defluviitaleaceae bacterium]|nr:30S ribosomal protein S12 methylthiotransferase RimO [Defluviitaleaceae bacterium]